MITSSDERLDRTFSALAHPIRRAILTRLARDGDASVSDLAEPFDVSLMAVSKHLKVMDEAGLIRRERDGRVHRCSFAPDAMDPAKRWMEKHERFWKRQLDSLATYLEAPDRDRPPEGGDDGGGRLHDEEGGST